MSRPDTEGFSIMDVSTHVLDDPKFLRLAISRPELYADCVVGFIATLARSWSKGRRVAAVEAWPAYRPANPDAIEALIEFRLLDRNGRLPAAWWRAEVVPFLRRRITRRRRLTLLRGFDREAVVAAFSGRCAYCGRSDGPMHVDHRMPLAKGGTDEQANLVLACRDCNLRKSDDDPSAWPLRFGAIS